MHRSWTSLIYVFFDYEIEISYVKGRLCALLVFSFLLADLVRKVKAKVIWPKALRPHFYTYLKWRSTFIFFHPGLATTRVTRLSVVSYILSKRKNSCCLWFYCLTEGLFCFLEISYAKFILKQSLIMEAAALIDTLYQKALNKEQNNVLWNVDLDKSSVDKVLPGCSSSVLGPFFLPSSQSIPPTHLSSLLSPPLSRTPPPIIFRFYKAKWPEVTWEEVLEKKGFQKAKGECAANPILIDLYTE